MSVNLELLEALRLATKQNSFDMLMTGEELRKCEAAIAHAEAAMCQGHAREGERDNPWKQAVIERLVVAHIYSVEHENDPLKAILDLLAYESDLAVYPRVSAAAERLVKRAMEHARDAAISEAADRCEAICHEQMRIGTERGASVADQCKDAVRRLRDGDVHTCMPPMGAEATAQPIPHEAIAQLLDGAMSEAVKNGASSVSMPDDYVKIACWLSGVAQNPARLTDEQIFLIGKEARTTPWGIGSRHTDAIEFARNVESAVLRANGFHLEKQS